MSSSSDPPPPQTSAIPPHIFAAKVSRPKAATEPAPNASPTSKRRFVGPYEAKPAPPGHWERQIPLMRFKMMDVNSEGARRFFSEPKDGMDVCAVLREAVVGVYETLYSVGMDVPKPRSVTLILEDMPGVAYTTGKSLDSDHKEIHFSTSYISAVSGTPARFYDEMKGVILHEMVHCIQYNARGSCPGGLIEGIADYVRLKHKLGPPHWSKRGTERWDQGYEKSAYFLQWLDRRFGPGTVQVINQALNGVVYKEHDFWPDVLGERIADLWDAYKKEELDDDDDEHSEERAASSEDEESSSIVHVEADLSAHTAAEQRYDAALLAYFGGQDLLRTRLAQLRALVASLTEMRAAGVPIPPSFKGELCRELSALEIVLADGAAQAVQDTLLGDDDDAAPAAHNTTASVLAPHTQVPILTASPRPASPIAAPAAAPSPLTTVLAARLSTLTYAGGTASGEAFLAEFEGLCARLAPGMDDADRKLLLAGSLRGAARRDWEVNEVGTYEWEAAREFVRHCGGEEEEEGKD